MEVNDLINQNYVIHT